MRIAEKIVNVVNLMFATPVENRENAITAIADPYLDATITAAPTYSLQFKTASFWQISQALRRQLGLFAVSIQLESKQWLNIHATLYSHFLRTQLIFIAVELLIFLMIIISFWVVGRFTKPFRSFKQMAERLGKDPNSELLPVEGPGIVKEASDAMNRMQQRIQELIRDRTQMLAAISHDLRTPITRMKLRTQFIIEDEVSNSLQADLCDMEEMINETMAFARDDASTEKRAPMDLVSLLSSVTDNYQDMGHKVKFKCKQNRIAFLGRRVALKRVFTNLINNAIRYASHVDSKIYRRHKNIIILIKDNGPGIAEKDIERVFAPFYRGEQSRSRDTGGVGLGLAVARDIIKAHGGQIDLRNMRLGGLCVIVQFPYENV